MTYDSASSDRGHFIVHILCAPIMFIQSPSGLYYYDMCHSCMVAFTQYDATMVKYIAKGYTHRHLWVARGHAASSL